jgi:hypothetical protein
LKDLVTKRLEEKLEVDSPEASEKVMVDVLDLV